MAPAEPGSHDPNAPRDTLARAGAGILLLEAPFAFDTPSIATGAPLIPLKAGDIVLNAWLRILEPWDDDDARGDYGGFVDGIYGWLNNTTGLPVAMNTAETDFFGDDPARIPIGSGAGPVTYSHAALIVNGDELDVARSNQPVHILEDFDFKVCITKTTAQADGDPSTATQGAGVLYLLIARPA